MFQEAINNYLKRHSNSSIQLKAVLFDMDGVLFDSMLNHAEAWHKTMKTRGLLFTCEEAYLNEGRTGADTINLIYQRELGRKATEKEIQEIYQQKTDEFNKHPQVQRMNGSLDVLNKIKKAGLFSMVVTGSGQKSLIGKLSLNFPGIFKPELMVTAFDVKNGKPNPEPYLRALQKGKLSANESIVIENAPLGVQAAVAAGIFTIAVNTGPLDDRILTDSGADILLPSMQAFADNWEILLDELRNCQY